MFGNVLSRLRLLGRPLAVLLAALLLAAVSAGLAWAHPSVVRSEPAANATVDTAPARVMVWFDEAIEPDYGNLSVYNDQGARVDNIDTRFTPGLEPSLTVTLPPLPKGSYVVAWRAFSVGDGHSVGGAFSFGYGVPPDVTAGAAANAQAEVEPDGVTQLIRVVGLLAQLVLAGVLAFRWWVWAPAVTGALRAGVLSPGSEQALAAELRRFATVLADVLVAGLVVGVLGALYVQARATGVYFWELFGTRWGLIWSVRLVAALWVALWLEGLLDGRRPAWVGGLLALTLLVTTTLTSHSSARPGLLGPLADLAHQLSAGVWLGGLVGLVLALWAVRRAPVEPAAQTRLSGEGVARFSGVAAASVGVLLASGLALSVQQVSSWAGLLLTDYGQTLVVKLLIVVVALAFAAYNALSAPRRVARGGRAAAWVGVEAAVVAGVVFVAALLTDLPPATANRLSGSAAAPDQALALTAASPGLTVTGRIQPARLGANVFEVALTDAGQPVRGARVALSFEPVGGGALATQLSLVEAPEGDGRYVASGGGLTRTGPWQILVSITPPGAAPQVFTTFDLEIGLDQVVRPAGTPLPARVRAVAWLNEFGRLALSVLILSVAAGWAWFVSRSIPGARRAGLLTVGLLLAALLWMLMLALTT